MKMYDFDIHVYNALTYNVHVNDTPPPHIRPQYPSYPNRQNVTDNINALIRSINLTPIEVP